MKLINRSFFILITLIVLAFQACKPSNKPIEIDFTEKATKDSLDLSTHSNYEFNVAVSAMISPSESFIYYQDLISYLSKKLNRPYKIVQRKTYHEVNLLLRNNQVEFAFVCSGAYIAEKEISDVKILAVPVCNEKPIYQAYVIANKNSTIQGFEDFRNKSFAYTDPLSNTGKLYALKRLRELKTSDEIFFSETIYTHAHDISIQMVSKNIIDGATVDGLIYEYIAKFSPERVENLKIIEKSEEFGIPPIIIPKGIDKDLEIQLKSTLLAMHEDPEGKKILDHLLIDRFEDGKDSNYNSIREMKKLFSE